MGKNQDAEFYDDSGAGNRGQAGGSEPVGSTEEKLSTIGLIGRAAAVATIAVVCILAIGIVVAMVPPLLHTSGKNKRSNACTTPANRVPEAGAGTGSALAPFIYPISMVLQGLGMCQSATGDPPELAALQKRIEKLENSVVDLEEANARLEMQLTEPPPYDAVRDSDLVTEIKELSEKLASLDSLAELSTELKAASLSLDRLSLFLRLPSLRGIPEAAKEVITRDIQAAAQLNCGDGNELIAQCETDAGQKCAVDAYICCALEICRPGDKCQHKCREFVEEHIRSQIEVPR